MPAAIDQMSGEILERLRQVRLVHRDRGLLHDDLLEEPTAFLERSESFLLSALPDLD
jgi:hypothetical protein